MAMERCKKFHVSVLAATGADRRFYPFPLGAAAGVVYEMRNTGFCAAVSCSLE
jgi:hypothetical protein